MRRQLSLAICLLVLPLVSCVTSTQGSVKSKPKKWLEPTPTLREDIEEQIQRLPFTHNVERVELIRWFAGVGEPAYPFLLKLARDERRGVASAAISALGATGDPRLVPELRALPWPTPEQDFGQALERARALLRLGDWDEIPVLITGLESERLWTRSLCARTLKEATNLLHGFDPKADEASRAKAVTAWRQWWREQSNDPLLETSAG